MPEGLADPGTTVTEPGLSAPKAAGTSKEVDRGWVQVIGPDGRFNEGWKNALPEEIRNEKCLDTVFDLPSLAKSFVSTKRMVGKDKVALLGEKPTEVELNEFYDAIGRPKTPEDYEIQRPQDFPEELWLDDFAIEAQKVFHQTGLTPRQAAALVDFNNKYVMKVFQEDAEAKEAARGEAEMDLRKEKGNAYEQFVHLGNIAINHGCGGNAEMQDRICQEYGDNPDFIRLMGNLGAKFAEHGTISIGKMEKTPADFQDQISELMHTDAYLNPQNPDHKMQVDKVQRLFQQKNASIQPPKGLV